MVNVIERIFARRDPEVRERVISREMSERKTEEKLETLRAEREAQRSELESRRRFKEEIRKEEYRRRAPERLRERFSKSPKKPISNIYANFGGQQQARQPLATPQTEGFERQPMVEGRGLRIERGEESGIRRMGMQLEQSGSAGGFQGLQIGYSRQADTQLGRISSNLRDRGSVRI